MRHLERARLAVLLVAALGLWACGGESGNDESTGGSSTNGGSTSGGSTSGGSTSGGSTSGGAANGGAAGTGGGASAACPTAAPINGEGCFSADDRAGFVRADCSFGQDPRPECRTLALCVDGHWQVTPPDAALCSEPPLPSTCPTTPPASGTECSDATARCWYEDGTHCACSPCMGGSEYPLCQTIDPPQWACSALPAGCPNPLPQAGTPCTQEDLSCGPSCELPIRCQNGVWVYEQANCPICASPDTPVATPVGERPIAELRPGDLVYSIDGAATIVVPLARVGSTPVAGHRVARIRLDDGTELEISPGHPTADGRHFSDLTVGSRLAERRVVSAELVSYRFDRTYDILPASATGTYFAGGVPVGSTLATASQCE